MGFWSAAAYVLDKIPLEKMLSKPPDDRERLQRLRQALEPPKKAAPAVAEAPDTEQPATLPVRRSAFHRPAPRQVGVDQVTTQETIDYQDRELGKLLLAMERHYRQGLRIAGKICDCGATKHLLDMEGMAEETISMAPDDTVYQRIVDFVREAGPHSTVEMVQTGQWDKIYPVYAATCRDLRKELLGTLDVGALWPEPTISRVPELPAPRAEAPVEAAVADTPETTTPQEEVAPST